MNKQVLSATLPVVNVFDPPYMTSTEGISEAYDIATEPDNSELKSINTGYLAAQHVLEVEDDIPLVNFITRALAVSPAMNEIRRLMPNKTPASLNSYQARYPNYDAEEVARDILMYGALLGNEQILFHGGIWPDDVDEFVSSRPLSSSFCPLAALKNALHKGKAHNSGRVDLLVLKAVDVQTPAYIFGTTGGLKHEKEVLFAAGATLRLIKRTLIKEGVLFAAGENFSSLSKSAPFYVVEVEIS